MPPPRSSGSSHDKVSCLFPGDTLRFFGSLGKPAGVPSFVSEAVSPDSFFATTCTVYVVPLDSPEIVVS